MTHSNRIILFDQNIKAELSGLIPNTSEGSFFRELIFEHSEIKNWFTIAMLIQRHFPEKKELIDLFCSKLAKQ